MTPSRNRRTCMLAIALLSATAIALLLGLERIRHASAAAPYQAAPAPLLIPIGGGYEEIYDGFSHAAAANNRRGYINIMVLPIPIATDPEAITDAERQENLRQAEQRRIEIEDACRRGAPSGMVCSAVLAPIFTRADALDPAALQYFQGELSAIFILDGDLPTAMQVINGTPLEVALTQAYETGVIIAGTGAGGVILSASMLGGYQPGFTPANALHFGAVEVWNTAERHGLPFGIRTAIIDQHFFERGQFQQLLNAITYPLAPRIGLGIDSKTGALIPAGARLEGVFGQYAVAVVDGETYNAAENVRFIGCGESDPVLPCRPLLSLRNVLVHLLAPGPFSFDLKTHRHSLAAPLSPLKRGFGALELPSGSGALLLSGDLPQPLEGNAVLERFAGLARAAGGRVLIYADGYPDASQAPAEVNGFRAAMKLPGPDLVRGVDALAQPPEQSQFDAVLVIARDQSRLHPGDATWLRPALLEGKPVLMAGAAAVLAGSFYAVHEPTPPEGTPREQAVQASFLLDHTEIAEGLAVLGLTIEPDIMSDERWGRLFSLAYNHPDLISIGLNENAGLEITSNGAVALGDNVSFVLDLRSAARSLGDNQAFVIANGLLDVFAPGEEIEPVLADIRASPSIQATPALVTATATATATPTVTPTPTQTPTATATAHPTRTPRPSLTPPIIPPPSNPFITNWMTAFGMFVVIVIIFGLLLNRRRL